MLLGGRAAEKIQFDQFSAGAENDLQEATRLARRMVTHWGMSERLGPVAYHISEDHPFLGREIAQHERQFSEHTAQVIDEEVAKILHAAEDRAKRTFQQHADKLRKAGRGAAGARDARRRRAPRADRPQRERRERASARRLVRRRWHRCANDCRRWPQAIGATSIENALFARREPG